MSSVMNSPLEVNHPIVLNKLNSEIPDMNSTPLMTRVDSKGGQQTRGSIDTLVNNRQDSNVIPPMVVKSSVATTEEKAAVDAPTIGPTIAGMMGGYEIKSRMSQGVAVNQQHELLIVEKKADTALFTGSQRMSHPEKIKTNANESEKTFESPRF